jgi:predicted alpha/beta superfamily hydrolase
MRSMTDHAEPADAAAHTDTATIIAVYPPARGRIALRGSLPPLGWRHDVSPDHVDGARSVFRVPLRHGDTAEVKLVRDDGAWMVGRNAVVGCGDTVELRPSFDRTHGVVTPARTLDVPGYGALRFRAMLPPGYDEQPDQRYPVLYVQDGQAVWSDGADPFGVWNLDHVLNELWDLGALEHLIVVSIDTADDRLARLSPVADPTYGGGGGQAHLDAIIGALKPLVDGELRTRRDRAATALLGSSMGGLFSLWAAWTRADVFGAAICLSPSLWWADRWMLRQIQRGACPAPRPRLYLDSGAARSALERDASTRDGVHNTRATYRALLDHCYAAGNDLHVLAFVDHHHDARSWAGRIAVPLQMAFPRAT